MISLSDFNPSEAYSKALQSSPIASSTKSLSDFNPSEACKKASPPSIQLVPVKVAP